MNNINNETKTKVNFLTQEERKEINDIVRTIRYTVKYYEENREDSKKLSIMGDDFSSVEKYAYYDKNVAEIEKIFANIKKRFENNEKELKKTEMLEQNVLTIMEKFVQGIDY